MVKSKVVKNDQLYPGLQRVKTTPYHPQTDGLVERHNQTLKNMLCKFFFSDRLSLGAVVAIYSLHRSYHKLPLSSYLPAYGHQVRGPLDLLRDRWEDPRVSETNVVSYVVKMRE